MAIARVFEGKGWTPDQYDKLIAALLDRLGRGERAAPGVLFHWVTTTADGMRATDVYESPRGGRRPRAGPHRPRRR